VLVTRVLSTGEEAGNEVHETLDYALLHLLKEKVRCRYLSIACWEIV
jgi:hypothetical protein